MLPDLHIDRRHDPLVQFLDRPWVTGHVRGHRRRSVRAGVHPAKVEVRDVDRDRTVVGGSAAENC